MGKSTHSITPSKPVIRNEVIGGLTTFFTMAYIIVVNPSLLSTPGTGITFQGSLTATVLLAFSMTLLMGLYAKLPYAVAPGLGINAFFTFTVILGKKVPWPTALGMLFWAGVLFLLISITPIRTTIARGIPKSLRTGTVVGIGIFLSFIGLKGAGLVVGSPSTLLTSGTIGTQSLLSLLGLGITVALMLKKSPFAFLAGILFITLTSWGLGLVTLPQHWFSAPDFHTVLFHLDILGALKLSLLPTIASFLFTDFFDSVSTFVGLSQAAGMLDEDGQPLRLREGLIVDALATLFAGLLGTSSGTAYLESASGIEMGGKNRMDCGSHRILFFTFSLFSSARGDGPRLRDRSRADSHWSFNVSQRYRVALGTIRRRYSCLPHHYLNPANLFHYPGDSLGLHLSCRAISAGWPT